MFSRSLGSALLGLAALASPLFAGVSSTLTPLSPNGTHIVWTAGAVPQDFTIPGGANALVLDARGGRGGNADAEGCVASGGKAARTQATFSIGTGSDDLAVGGTVRFIVGYSGIDASSQVSGLVINRPGGGGTGVLYLAPGLDANNPSNWEILMVAGGGGGALARRSFFFWCVTDDGGDASLTPDGTKPPGSLPGDNTYGGTNGGDGSFATSSHDEAGGHGYLSATIWGSSLAGGESYGYGRGGGPYTSSDLEVQTSGAGGGYSGGGAYVGLDFPGGGGGSYVGPKGNLPTITHATAAQSSQVHYSLTNSPDLTCSGAPELLDGTTSLDLSTSTTVWRRVRNPSSCGLNVLGTLSSPAGGPNDMTTVEVFADCGATTPIYSQSFPTGAGGFYDFYVPEFETVWMKFAFDGVNSAGTELNTQRNQGFPQNAWFLGAKPLPFDIGLFWIDWSTLWSCTFQDLSVEQCPSVAEFPQDVWYSYHNPDPWPRTLHIGWESTGDGLAAVSALTPVPELALVDCAVSLGGQPASLDVELGPGETRLLRFTQDAFLPNGELLVSLSRTTYPCPSINDSPSTAITLGDGDEILGSIVVQPDCATPDPTIAYCDPIIDPNSLDVWYSYDNADGFTRTLSLTWNTSENSEISAYNQDLDPISCASNEGPEPTTFDVDVQPGERVLLRFSQYPELPIGFIDVAVEVSQYDPWTDLGNALPGFEPVPPQLTGTGTLEAESEGSIDLVEAAPLAITGLFLGLSEVNVPFKGGVLVPSPDFLFTLNTDGTGAWSVPFTFPVGVPESTSLYLQAWIVDGSQTTGFTASNGLRGVTAP